MKGISASDVVLKVLGVLLVAAAVLKAHALLTVPVANEDIWSWRPFLILQVDGELAMGIWLLSGLLKRLAWLVTLACFASFCCITLYKGLAGYASCGCFGRAHVNPWITLSLIDLPATVALALFRPAHAIASIRNAPHLAGRLLRLSVREFRALRRGKPAQRPSHWRLILRRLLAGLPPLRFATAVLIGVVALSISTSILALGKPAVVTSSYEVLDPETWIGTELPILQHIDVARQLRQGNWFVLLYHHDCPDCQAAIPRYERMATDLGDNEDLLRVALIEVPPYGPLAAPSQPPCVRGRLANTKEWFITTPAAVLLAGGTVKAAWQAETPDFDTVLAEIARSGTNCRDSGSSFQDT